MLIENSLSDNFYSNPATHFSWKISALRCTSALNGFGVAGSECRLLQTRATLGQSWPGVAAVLSNQDRDFHVADSLPGSVWIIQLRNDYIVHKGSDKLIAQLISMLKGKEEDTFQYLILSPYLQESGHPSCSSRSIYFRKFMMMKSLELQNFCTMPQKQVIMERKKQVAEAGEGGPVRKSQVFIYLKSPFFLQQPCDWNY